MDLSPWYRVCTNKIFISKGTYWYGESRNVFQKSVQKPLFAVRAIKLPCLKGLGIGSRKETCVNWGGPIPMVPCLHLSNMDTKRKLRLCIDQKCIPLLCVNTPLTCASRQIIPSQGRRYRVENGNLRKLG